MITRKFSNFEIFVHFLPTDDKNAVLRSKKWPKTPKIKFEKKTIFAKIRLFGPSGKNPHHFLETVECTKLISLVFILENKVRIPGSIKQERKNFTT